MTKKLIDLSKYPCEQGVYIHSKITSGFETDYLKVREREKRIYSDEELKLLPFASVSNPHINEWIFRTKSFNLFKNYLSTKSTDLNILDLGSGNGWFCGQLSEIFINNFYCIDINLTELKQAARVFKSERIEFIYADIFTMEIPEYAFNIITVNAAVQYFPDLKKLLNRLLTLINENGEVHILDSPFYHKDQAENAKQRTVNYYSSIGFPEMVNNYYHHNWNELSEFKSEILCQPDSMIRRIKRLFSKTDSPFPWIVIRK